MRDLTDSGVAIAWTAPPDVSDVITGLRRSEDVRFSPDNHRLAVADFIRNRIAVFDLDITRFPAGTRVALTGGVELSSPALNMPHGLDFIDDETLIVANRGGDVAILTVPAGEVVPRSVEALPIQTWPADGTSLLTSPGAVSVTTVERDLREILICNNFGQSVTRHLLDVRAGGVVRSSEVLLRKWLDVPDGVDVSLYRQWIAISNHNAHSVLLYKNVASLSEHADPDGILRHVRYPHGLCFSPDGCFLFVADTGAPCVHIYARDDAGWGGVRHPAATIRIMDDSLFERMDGNREEGGPKGLDIDAGAKVLVVVSEGQPLAFFGLPALLDRASAGNPVPTWNPRASERFQHEQRALQVSCELSILEQSNLIKTRASEAAALVEKLRNSRSWRMTAPLRRLNSALQMLCAVVGIGPGRDHA